ncbi:hypothetical protein GCM10026983_10970 [Gracilibacillus alcaliphilus]
MSEVEQTINGKRTAAGRLFIIQLFYKNLHILIKYHIADHKKRIRNTVDCLRKQAPYIKFYILLTSKLIPKMRIK